MTGGVVVTGYGVFGWSSGGVTSRTRMVPGCGADRRSGRKYRARTRAARNGARLLSFRGVRGYPPRHVTPIDSEDAARRLVRVIVSDIELYNRESLGDPRTVRRLLDEGYALFKSRVVPALPYIGAELVHAAHVYLKNCATRQRLSGDHFRRTFEESDVYRLI